MSNRPLHSWHANQFASPPSASASSDEPSSSLIRSLPCGSCLSSSCGGCLTPFGEQIDALTQRVIYPPPIPINNYESTRQIQQILTNRSISNTSRDRQHPPQRHHATPRKYQQQIGTHGTRRTQLGQYANSILETFNHSVSESMRHTSDASLPDSGALNRAQCAQRPGVFSRALRFDRRAGSNNNSSDDNLNMDDPNAVLRETQSAEMVRLLADLRRTRDARAEAARAERAARVNVGMNGTNGGIIQSHSGIGITQQPQEEDEFESSFLKTTPLLHSHTTIEKAIDMNNNPESCLEAEKYREESEHGWSENEESEESQSVKRMINMNGEESKEEVNINRRHHRHHTNHTDSTHHTNNDENDALPHRSTSPLPIHHSSPYTSHPIRGFVVRLHDSTSLPHNHLTIAQASPRELESNPHIWESRRIKSEEETHGRARVVKKKIIFQPMIVEKMGKVEYNSEMIQKLTKESEEGAEDPPPPPPPPPSQSLSSKRIRTLTESTFFHSPNARLLQATLTGRKGAGPIPLRKEGNAGSGRSGSGRRRRRNDTTPTTTTSDSTLLHHLQPHKHPLDDLLGHYAHSLPTQHSILSYTQRSKYWQARHHQEERRRQQEAFVKEQFDRRPVGNGQVRRRTEGEQVYDERLKRREEEEEKKKKKKNQSDEDDDDREEKKNANGEREEAESIDIRSSHDGIIRESRAMNDERKDDAPLEQQPQTTIEGDTTTAVIPPSSSARDQLVNSLHLPSDRPMSSSLSVSSSPGSDNLDSPSPSHLRFESVRMSQYPSPFDRSVDTTLHDDDTEILLGSSTTGLRLPTTAIFRASAHVDSRGRQYSTSHSSRTSSRVGSASIGPSPRHRQTSALIESMRSLLYSSSNSKRGSGVSDRLNRVYQTIDQKSPRENQNTNNNRTNTQQHYQTPRSNTHSPFEAATPRSRFSTTQP